MKEVQPVPKIDFTAMPAVELRNFCRTFSAAIKRSTEDPDFVEVFNNWRREITKENQDPMVNEIDV